MIFGYHVNGFSDVPLDRVVDLLDEAGYGSIALSVGGQFFDPMPGTSCQEEVERLARTLRERNLGSIVEVEAGHRSLITVDPDGRRSYLKLCEHAIDVAATLRSDCVVLRSGTFIFNAGGGEEGAEEGAEEDGPEAAWARLVDSLGELLAYAEERAVPIGFEPSFGMLVDTTDAFNRLLGQIPSGMLRLSLDLATLNFMGETPLAHFLHIWSGRLVNLYFCDVKVSAPKRRLMLGEGEIDFSPLFVALDEAGYSGGVHVRFDGPPSGDGSEQMVHAMRFLRQAARF